MVFTKYINRILNQPIFVTKCLKFKYQGRWITDDGQNIIIKPHLQIEDELKGFSSYKVIPV